MGLSDKVSIRVSPWLWVILGALLLFMPLRWVLSLIGGIVIHELGHVLAVRLMGQRIYGISITPGGVTMRTSPMSAGEELICAMAGPLAGGLLIMMGRYFPCLAICAFCQTVFNLLPIHPLDGGRMLRCCARILIPRAAERAAAAVELGCLACIAFFSFYFAAVGLGLLPLMLAIAAAVRAVQEKFLANRHNSGYNSATILK